MVDERTGEQYYLDAHVACRRACFNAMEYLRRLGRSGEQGYMILGAVPVESRSAGIVDIPLSARRRRSRPASSTSTSGPAATGRNARSRGFGR